MNWELIWLGFQETCMMTLFASVFAYLLGLPLGVLLVITRKGSIKPMPTFNMVLGAIINFLRSIPFILLIAMLIPVTRAVMGTSIGTAASVFPLVISAAPYVARMVESSLLEVESGVVEAAQAMGSSNWQIIWKVMIPESVPSLISNFTIAITTVLGYSAMSGIIGGGGLGKIAINYGYYRYKYLVMMIAVIFLILLVQIFQAIGTRLAVKSDKRLKKS